MLSEIEKNVKCYCFINSYDFCYDFSTTLRIFTNLININSDINGTRAERRDATPTIENLMRK